MTAAAFRAEVDVQRVPDVMAWLCARVPLTLAMDLLDADGPNSEQILREERPTPMQAAWLSTLVG